MKIRRYRQLRLLPLTRFFKLKGACIFAGYLKLLPLFIMVLPGMAARVLYPDEVGCADPVLCKVRYNNSELDGRSTTDRKTLCAIMSVSIIYK